MTATHSGDGHRPAGRKTAGKDSADDQSSWEKRHGFVVKLNVIDGNWYDSVLFAESCALRIRAARSRAGRDPLIADILYHGDTPINEFDTPDDLEPWID